MKHIHYLLLSVLFAFSSCQNNEETVIENNFKGHYKITAMESDQPLDLNNDGISSSNLYEEIAAPVHGNNKDETPIPFYHFDVYRIGDVEEMDEIGYEDYIYGEGVSLIEWANLIEEILPEHYTEIKIEKDLEKGFDYRRITICEY